jgi:hypothetical protein
MQKERVAYYEQLVAGNAPKQKLLKYVKADECSLNIAKQFDSQAPLE